jgi:hypothetical protein
MTTTTDDSIESSPRYPPDYADWTKQHGKVVASGLRRTWAEVHRFQFQDGSTVVAVRIDDPKLQEWDRRHGGLTARVPLKRWAEARDYHFKDGTLAKVLYWTDPSDGDLWLVLRDPDERRPAPDYSHLPAHARPAPETS